jgi:hypothetical protein
MTLPGEKNGIFLRFSGFTANLTPLSQKYLFISSHGSSDGIIHGVDAHNSINPVVLYESELII